MAIAAAVAKPLSQLSPVVADHLRDLLNEEIREDYMPDQTTLVSATALLALIDHPLADDAVATGVTGRNNECHDSGGGSWHS